MSRPTEKSIADFQSRVLEWYGENKRDLPWRQTTDPYAILVSEVMLQQTQVDRVIPFFLRWLESFPDFAALAKADKREVLAHWSGLGYNNRALRLQKLAQDIVEYHGGSLPKEEEELRNLPGIGPYTARAVIAFAFNKEVPVVDTNIRRVLIHELALPEEISVKDLEDIASRCVPKGKSCIWHNALMDYGAMEKTARATGIRPLSRQTKFEGSDREVRGYIVKTLVQSGPLGVADVKRKYGKERTSRVINALKSEGIIATDGDKLSLEQ